LYLQCNWKALIKCLDNWSDSASVSAAVAYAGQQLDNWSDDDDYLRMAPSAQWEEINASAENPC
jgi:hypothetical protein